jgi:hypothetical protein
MTFRFRAALAVLMLTTVAGSAAAGTITLLGKGEISGSASDLSGLGG